MVVVRPSPNEWHSQIISLPQIAGKIKIRIGGNTKLRDKEIESAFFVF